MKTPSDQAVEAATIKIGGKYNWINQPDRLIYLGKNGAWHQFRKIGDPRDVWCEVRDSDLRMIEKTVPDALARPLEVAAPVGDEDLRKLATKLRGVWVFMPEGAGAEIVSEAVKALEVAASRVPVALGADFDSSELNQHTADLVVRFARALAEKLLAAERKYGYSDGWRSADWMDECRASLMKHVAKGDPRDVAAYCAFLWHHGESTATPPAGAGCSVNAGVVLENTQVIRDLSKQIAENGATAAGQVLHEAALEIERIVLATPAAPVPARGGEDLIAVPRDLIGAACSAIDKKRDAPNVLAKLRRYTTGDLSAVQPIQAQDATDARVVLPPMDEHLADILGMMCFQCIELSRMLRASGQTIATKAEAEQAAVIYWLLGFYFEHGPDWRKAASAEVKKYHDAAILASNPPAPAVDGRKG